METLWYPGHDTEIRWNDFPLSLQSNKGNSSEECNCQVYPQPDMGTGDDALHPCPYCVSGIAADEGCHPCGECTGRLGGTPGSPWFGRDKSHVLKFKLERKVLGTHQMLTVHSAKSHLSQLPTSYRPEPCLFSSKMWEQTVVPLKCKCSCVQFPRR